MGRRATGTVEPLRGSIRLKFTFAGTRRVERLDLAPTPANIKAAERLMARIQGAIDHGVYRDADFFSRPGAAPTETFREYALEWLKTLTGAKSTKRSYRSALNSTWIPALGDKRLTEIRHSDIKKAVADKAATVTGKTVNNALIPLRDVLATAMRDHIISSNPADGIENLAHQAPEPDPLTREEMESVLGHMAAKFAPQAHAYFEFAFHTGMRPSEIISLRWGDIDWKGRKARVQRARVDWEEKGTKTNKVRDVHLSDNAMAALRRQKPHTFMRGLEAEVFNNPITLGPWPDEQVQRRRYFAPTLRALGLRHRDAYQTRHTFATLALMGGINVGFIAKQLGHAKITTTLNRYARWLEEADKGAEAAKLNAVLSSNCPREASDG